MGNRPYFVIAGLIMHEAQWHGIADEVRRIKTKYGVTGEIKWRYFGPDNTDPGNSVAHLNEGERRGRLYISQTTATLESVATLLHPQYEPQKNPKPNAISVTGQSVIAQLMPMIDASL
ncbi:MULTISPECIES: hypothetical protein [unclassified Mesorhizobium]|uniref:hypothetical protein n=1 Tax=unclassified Mesorhizobium TaxID=325217 RepID=UPI00241610E9|nr:MULTISPECIES: hypothetical protein [unclassified Mesorhizobium]MDG4899681.1 hypothetical protein [Mesorhizobium sp. WSM4962]MDG4918082.1 hypothetical protein [Mesorhizobium sp. WSM4989]